MEVYHQQMDPAAVLHACGACGRAGFDFALNTDGSKPLNRFAVDVLVSTCLS